MRDLEIIEVKSMEKAKKYFKMTHIMKVCFKMDKDMALELRS
jgi:hypothetical protein